MKSKRPAGGLSATWVTDKNYGGTPTNQHDSLMDKRAQGAQIGNPKGAVVQGRVLCPPPDDARCWEAVGTRSFLLQGDGSWEWLCLLKLTKGVPQAAEGPPWACPRTATRLPEHLDRDVHCPFIHTVQAGSYPDAHHRINRSQ